MPLEVVSILFPNLYSDAGILFLAMQSHAIALLNGVLDRIPGQQAVKPSELLAFRILFLLFRVQVNCMLVNPSGCMPVSMCQCISMRTGVSTRRTLASNGDDHLYQRRHEDQRMTSKV